MKNAIVLTFSLILLGALAWAQQPAAAPAAPAAGAPAAPVQFAPNTLIPVELSKSVDAKKLKVGDPIDAKTSVDMLANGKIIMPRNSKVDGHVVSVKAHSKASPDSNIGIAFDRLAMKDGQDMPLQASVQAVGAPLNSFASGGSAPNMGGPGGGPGGPGGMSGGGGGQRSGGGGSTSSQPSYPSGGMPTMPDGTTPSRTSTGALSASSQGVVGLKDLSLEATPQASVFSSNSKNVHLDTGTQLLLKVQ
jgi:hypothetical protein